MAKIRRWSESDFDARASAMLGLNLASTGFSTGNDSRGKEGLAKTLTALGQRKGDVMILKDEIASFLAKIDEYSLEDKLAIITAFAKRVKTLFPLT